MITHVFKDVEISKADLEWHVNHYANEVYGYFSVKLRNKHNPSVELKNTQVTIYINGKAHTKKTNDNGNAKIYLKSLFKIENFKNSFE